MKAAFQIMYVGPVPGGVEMPCLGFCGDHVRILTVLIEVGQVGLVAANDC